MRTIVGLISGGADIGRTRVFWIGFGVIVLLFLLYPTQASAFRVSNVSYYLLNIPLKPIQNTRVRPMSAPPAIMPNGISAALQKYFIRRAERTMQ